MTKNLLAIALSLHLAAPAGAAQSPAEPPRVVGSVEVSLINVDVVVIDKEGKPAHGLSPADFEVLHGKRPVTITNFREEISRTTTVNPSPAAPAKEAGRSAPTPAVEPGPQEPEGVRQRKHIVLFIDNLALPEKNEREEVFGAMKRLLRKTVEPGDAAMVVVWRRGVQTIQPFTSDFAALDRTIDFAAGRSIRRGGEEKSEVEKLAADDWAYAWAESPGDSQLTRRLDAMQVYAEAKGKATAMKGLIAMMSGMEGRKALIFVSRNFSRFAGAEYAAPIDTGAIIDSVTAAANVAGVTIHTMYAAAWESDAPSTDLSQLMTPRGGVTTSGLSLVQRRWLNEMQALAPLAEQTGGVNIGTTMEVGLFADRVANDLTSWYSIGYPTPAGTNATAEVSVKVKRPGLTVRSRRAHYERTPEEQMQDRVLANLFRPDVAARLPIAVSSETAKLLKKGQYRMPVRVRIPAKNLVLLRAPRGLKGAVSVFSAWAGPGGEFSEVSRKHQDVEFPEGSEVERAIITVETEIITNDPAARVSIGVWDETSKDAGFRLIRPAS